MSHSFPTRLSSNLFFRRVIRVQISRNRKLHTIFALALFDMVAMGLASRFKSNGSYFFAKLVNLHIREYFDVDRVDVCNEVGRCTDFVWHFCFELAITCENNNGFETPGWKPRSEAHTSELQSLMRILSAVFFLKKKNN